ncbi:MAG TPA: TrkA family potassium uptake protein [Armatimonadota bacterium]|nr:TrkA family potassium uptake protein [Armatimonadota bacterium]
MRVIILGSSRLALQTAEIMINRGDEVVIIERDPDKAAHLAESMDCAIVEGDGADPNVQSAAEAGDADAFVAATRDDQTNIVAAIVARRFGIGEVIVKLENPDYIPVCEDLGLTKLALPEVSFAMYVSEMARGLNLAEIGELLRGDARLFRFMVDEHLAGTPVYQLNRDLPEDTSVIVVLRTGSFLPVREEVVLQAGDEVLVVTRQRNLADLTRTYTPSQR